MCMTIISCPICGVNEGKAVGITNIVIKCRKCGRFFWYKVDEKELVQTCIVEDVNKAFPQH